MQADTKASGKTSGRAVRVHEPGGPEKLALDTVDVPAPGPGQVLVRVHAVGVNFIDVYHRTGLYPMPRPMPLGLEGAGVVEASGAGVGADMQPGARVAWSGVPGSYATHLVAPAERLVPVPDGVGLEDAAAAMLQGMTAHYLAHDTFRLGAEHTCLVHAAAGGVGLLLCQMARTVGARVIGTTSTADKAERARQAGADEVILYTEQDFVAEVKRITGGAGVHVAYDSVGKTTFEGSIKCLARRGLLVLFGQSSGPIGSFDPLLLSRHGSLYVTRPTLMDYTVTRAELLARAAAVLDAMRAGTLRISIDRTFPLAQAADAHRLLESRQTSGKLLLIP
jgi:NADPH2:quinone reductase